MHLTPAQAVCYVLFELGLPRWGYGDSRVQHAALVTHGFFSKGFDLVLD